MQVYQDIETSSILSGTSVTHHCTAPVMVHHVSDFLQVKLFAIIPDQNPLRHIIIESQEFRILHEIIRILLYSSIKEEQDTTLSRFRLTIKEIKALILT